MRAVTLMQPWGHAVVHGTKNIENRKTLMPSAELLAEPRPLFAIHAGLRYSMLGYSFPEGQPVPSRDDCTFGAVIGVARVAGVLDSRKEVVHIWALPDNEWWLGPIGWLLADRMAIKPVPCKGHLSCWTLPADVEEKVLGQLPGGMR